MTGSHPGLRRGHRCRPEKRVHERLALKILQILDRFPDSDESYRQLEFLPQSQRQSLREQCRRASSRTKPVTPTA